MSFLWEQPSHFHGESDGYLPYLSVEIAEVYSLVSFRFPVAWALGSTALGKLLCSGFFQSPGILPDSTSRVPRIALHLMFKFLSPALFLHVEIEVGGFGKGWTERGGYEYYSPWNLSQPWLKSLLRKERVGEREPKYSESLAWDSMCTDALNRTQKYMGLGG